MNRLDKYGFNWYNPPENIEIVSTMNLLNEAVFYRVLLEDPTQTMSPILSVYNSFNLFITRVENLMNTHTYLHPDYIDSTLNLSDRVARAKELFAPFNELGGNSWYALTIMEWSDLEDITGEDLTVFKDRTLRVNEVFGVGLLTKMYKVVDAFRYRRQQNSAESHLIGEFLGQIEYTDFYNSTTRWTDTGVSSNSLYDSYSFADRNNIESSNSNAHDEFVNVFNQSKANKITLTTQILSGQPYDSRTERPPNDFRASKQWLYRGFGTSSFGYDYNENQKSYYGCPISPKFSRGNTTNVYKSRTEVFSYNQSQDITDIDFYEAYCFWQKTDGFDFGTGLIQDDGGVIPYTKNQDNTMETDVFVNFSDNASSFPQLNNTTYTLQLGSRTFFNLNDAEFNEYKTASPTN